MCWSECGRPGQAPKSSFIKPLHLDSLHHLPIWGPGGSWVVSPCLTLGRLARLAAQLLRHGPPLAAEAAEAAAEPGRRSAEEPVGEFGAGGVESFV